MKIYLPSSPHHHTRAANLGLSLIPEPKTKHFIHTSRLTFLSILVHLPDIVRGRVELHFAFVLFDYLGLISDCLLAD